MIISSIEFDNNNPDKLWAAVYTTSAKLNLFVSDDFGQSWVNTSKVLPPELQFYQLSVTLQVTET